MRGSREASQEMRSVRSRPLIILRKKETRCALVLPKRLQGHGWGCGSVGLSTCMESWVPSPALQTPGMVAYDVGTW